MGLSPKVWLAAPAFGVLLGGALLLPRPKPPTRAEPARPTVHDEQARAELDALQRDLALTRAEVRGLRQERGVPAPTVEATSVAEPAPAAAPRMVTPEAAQARFQSIIEQEALDASWARSEEQSIRDFVRTEGASVESLTCRSTMCRLEVGFADAASREGFKQKLGLPPLDKGGFYREQADSRLVFYSAREGHPLPNVPSDE